jgi:hypothetical protein
LRIYLPPEKWSSNDFAVFLVLLLFISTIVLPYAVYKLGVKIALRNKPKDDDRAIENAISTLSN